MFNLCEFQTENLCLVYSMDAIDILVGFYVSGGIIQGFVSEIHSHIADITFYKILKLHNEIMRYNQLQVKGTSVHFETCMLPLIYPHYLCKSSF